MNLKLYLILFLHTTYYLLLKIHIYGIITIDISTLTVELTWLFGYPW